MRADVLAYAQFISKQHGIIVITIHSDSANENKRRKDKLIMGCETWGNYKRKKSYECSYSMKVKFSFKLRFVSSGSGLKVMVRCEFHNHKLAKDLDGCGVW